MKLFDRHDLMEIINFVEDNITKVCVVGLILIIFFGYMIRVNFFMEREPEWLDAVRIECTVGDSKWVIEPAYSQNEYVAEDRIFFYYNGEYIQVKPLHLCNVYEIEKGKYPQHYFNYYGEFLK